MIESKRPIILCADDYALSPGVSRAVCALLAAGRLSAASVMTASRLWPEHAAWLKPFAESADIGLHFALTDLVPLGPMPRLAPTRRFPALGRTLVAALARRIEPDEVRDELERQIDAFTAAMGRLPAFVDGHQHVHQLPVVRDVVIDVVCRRLPDAYLRICDEPASAILRRGVAPLRAMTISLLGRRLRRLARRHGIAANRRFAGVHDFSGRDPFPALCRRFLADSPAGFLVMCHPGTGEAGRSTDPIAAHRVREFEYLSSGEFVDDLAHAGCSLARFSQACGRETSSAAD
ncbi:MAG: ChbG/HpnK family deacetylase [Proteobacteria bacterium]|nr:ChbG/HpnK family deacetylase [Pseudomonadota bacterium]